MSDRIAVIGAGITGLTCARELADAGREVVLLDKGRGLGGRMATRRVGNDVAFDHGTQFFRARTPAFRAVVQDAEAAGAVAEWASVSGNDPAWVGTPGMNGLAKFLADGLKVSLSTEITRVVQNGDGWRLIHSDGTLDATHLVCTVPVVQARTLLGHLPAMTEQLAHVEPNPCWALMLGFAARVDLPDHQRPEDSPLAWIARNSSKPGRPESECWIAHATPAWTEDHLEEEKDAVAQHLLAAFEGLVPALPEVLHVAAHRWRYATTKTPLGKPFLQGENLHIGGDWCLGARVEDGFESGRAIAADILGSGL